MRSLLLILSMTLFGDQGERPYVIFRGHNSGMFSVFNDVLALLKYYDQGAYQGIQVDFGRNGLYFDSERGDNWWSYFCEPISFQASCEPVEVFGDVPFARRREAEWHTTRSEAHALIEKYIRIRPHILEKVDSFVKEHFKERFVIGVHYRGTDKMKEEAQLVHYPSLMFAVRDRIRELNRKDVAIYIATDEEPLIAFFCGVFGVPVFCQKEAKRTTKKGVPPHLDLSYNRYLAGQEALIDCLLLSRCNFLIRTSSNLSLWSTFFNPNIFVIELNQRIDDEKPSE